MLLPLSDGGLTPITDIDKLLITYRGGSYPYLISLNLRGEICGKRENV